MVAAVAIIIGGAIAYALAFTGSQVATKAFGGDGGSLKEVKRHEAALKQQKAQAEYNQKRADAVCKLNARLAAEGAATRRLNDYVEESRLYKEVMSNKWAAMIL